MRRRALIALPLLLSCGFYSRDQREWDAAAAPTVARVSQYQTLLSASTSVSTTQCVADRDAYVADMRGYISTLEDLASRTDGCFSTGYGSVMGMCVGMAAELERYAREGCSSEDASQNRTDGLAHCSNMLTQLDSAQNAVDSCD